MQNSMADIVLQAGIHVVEEMMTQTVLGATTMKNNPMAVVLFRSVLMSNTKEGYAASVRATTGAGDEGAILWEKLPKSARILFIGGKEDTVIAPDILKAVSAEVLGSQLVMLDFGQ